MAPRTFDLGLPESTTEPQRSLQMESNPAEYSLAVLISDAEACEAVDRGPFTAFVHAKFGVCLAVSHGGPLTLSV
jgi:hypothetical protein